MMSSSKLFRAAVPTVDEGCVAAEMCSIHLVANCGSCIAVTVSPRRMVTNADWPRPCDADGGMTATSATMVTHERGLKNGQ